MTVAGLKLYKGEIRITAWRTLTKAEIERLEAELFKAFQVALKDLPAEILTIVAVAHKTPSEPSRFPSNDAR